MTLFQLAILCSVLWQISVTSTSDKTRFYFATIWALIAIAVEIAS